MNSTKLYSEWNSSYLQQFIDEQALADEWDDPEVGPDIRLNLLEDLEKYLRINGTKLKENNHFIEHKNNLPPLYTNINFLAYKLGATTIFIRHVEYMDDWPLLSNPERETIAIKIYSKNSIDKVIRKIKSKLKLTPEIFVKA